jgi:hypothetical protein
MTGYVNECELNWFLRWNELLPVLSSLDHALDQIRIK